MSKRLQQVLLGKEDNYLLPFYWQHGDHIEKIPEQLERIFGTGCRDVCIESRPHGDFCGDGWWRDMDIIMDICRRRGARVWVLDDKKFPTGYANGAIRDKYPHLCARTLIEYHVDVAGPMAEASVLVRPSSEDHYLLSAVAFRRSGEGESMVGEPIDLTANVHGGYLYWDVPQGLYRIFMIFRSRAGIRPDYINLLSRESVNVLIDEVYEKHYAHYAADFGKTFAGFFSDEPAFTNDFFSHHSRDDTMHRRTVGQDGLALPYSEQAIELMSATLGCDARLRLPELWYGGEGAPETRHAYMDAVTRLYRDCFSRTLGDWCRAHGVEYIGHIIEDMGAHARLGHGPGHYFRALDGQDMGGIDVVLHQVMPGFAHIGYNVAASSSNREDATFFHYALGKLGASIAHQHPRMRGRAMCEVFGAYGWGEGAPMMKWLIDFLLVRGINRFVPHAFSPCYPDPDCPPHMGAEGHDPQLDGFSALMRYTNKAAHLLTDGTHVASAAILYHAEAEWMSGYEIIMPMEAVARELYDDHIDYDFVCADVLSAQAKMSEGKLCIGKESFAALIVPYAPVLPTALIERLNELSAQGLAVLYVNEPPRGAVGRTVDKDRLTEVLRELGAYEIRVLQGKASLMRIYHVKSESADTYMLFNESPDEATRATLSLGAKGAFARLRLLEDEAWREVSEDGSVTVELLPGQSEILVFSDEIDACELPAPAAPLDSKQTLTPTYTITLADADDLDAWREYRVTDTLFNVTGPHALPDFSGRLRYTFTLELDHSPERAVLDLGRVGQTARLYVNGRDVGIRIAAPYRFTLTDELQKGKNTLCIEVANTLVGKQRDHFSHYLPLPPTGLLGPLTLEW